MRLPSGIGQLLKRPVKQYFGRRLERKFKSAIPLHSGDSFLLSTLGKIISSPGMAEKAFREGEVFLIKGGLFLSGVNVDPSADEGIGAQWKEDAGQHHFNPSTGLRNPHLGPYAIHMPHGFYSPLYLNPNSPFTLRRDKGNLFLYLQDLRLFPVQFEKRPGYYSRNTSTGVPMRHIGPHRLKRQVLFEYNAYCRYFADNTQCLFCGIMSERPVHHGHYQSHFVASPTEIAEVDTAAYVEDGCTELQLTGGVLPERAEVPYFMEVGRAIKERMGLETIPGSQAVLVPPQDLRQEKPRQPDFRQIEQLKESGWQGVAFNMEIWNEGMWPGFVPGKNATMPREKWLEALVFSVGVFGKGQVTTVLIAGLEPKESHWEGVEWLAERGIYGVPIPWSPMPGSALEGHQTPTAAWHLEVTARTLDIWEKYGLDPHRHSSGGLHYSDLATMRQHWRESQKRNADNPAEQDQKGDLSFRLAIEGKLPEM